MQVIPLGGLHCRRRSARVSGAAVESRWNEEQSSYCKVSYSPKLLLVGISFSYTAMVRRSMSRECPYGEGNLHLSGLIIGRSGGITYKRRCWGLWEASFAREVMKKTVCLG